MTNIFYFPIDGFLSYSFVYFYQNAVIESFDDWVEIDCVFCSAQIGIDTRFVCSLCDCCESDPRAQKYFNQCKLAHEAFLL